MGSIARYIRCILAFTVNALHIFLVMESSMGENMEGYTTVGVGA